MRRRSQRLVWALVLGVTLTACSGPTRKVDVGVVQFGTDVIFGAPKPDVLPPVPPGALTVAPPSLGVPIITGHVLTPGVQPTTPVPTAPPLPCPKAGPFAVSLDAPTTTIAKPPVAATYHYRNVGSYQASGATPITVAYPTASTRQVKNVAPTTTGGFTFDVVNTLGTVTATSSYTYLPSSNTSSLPAATPTSGLYLTRIQQVSGNKVISDFTADGPGLLLLQTPAVAGTSWYTTATDAATGAVMSMGVRIGTNKRVDACGQVITAPVVHVDGEVHLSEGAVGQQVDVPVPVPSQSGGTSVSAVDNSSTTFTGDYVIATQYGGLSVMDTVQQQGTSDGAGVASTNASTINSVPATR